jgi:haloalkane dehalogenase
VTIGNGFLPNVPAGEEIYPVVEEPNQVEDIPTFFDRYTPQQAPYYDNCVRLIEEFDFFEWMVYTMKSSNFTASEVVEGWTWVDIPEDEEAAYDAPFPSREYMAGARVFPSLLNETPGVTQQAWLGLSQFEKPFLTIWGANDPLDLGDCELQQALIDNIPGASGQPHVRFPDASHFLQNDKGEEIAERLVTFFNNPIVSESRVGYELLNVISDSEMIAWRTFDITEAEYNALELPSGWNNGQIRELNFDDERFKRSPGSENDGPLTVEELFGFSWEHVATIIERGIDLNDDGLLLANRVDKHHELTYRANRTVSLIVSPEGDHYVLATRDPNRTEEEPAIPSSWQKIDTLINNDWIIELPNPTLNIRTQNQDSYQGPIIF